MWNCTKSKPVDGSEDEPTQTRPKKSKRTKPRNFRRWFRKHILRQRLPPSPEVKQNGEKESVLQKRDDGDCKKIKDGKVDNRVVKEERKLGEREEEEKRKVADERKEAERYVGERKEEERKLGNGVKKQRKVGDRVKEEKRKVGESEEDEKRKVEHGEKKETIVAERKEVERKVVHREIVERKVVERKEEERKLGSGVKKQSKVVDREEEKESKVKPAVYRDTNDKHEQAVRPEPVAGTSRMSEEHEQRSSSDRESSTSSSRIVNPMLGYTIETDVDTSISYSVLEKTGEEEGEGTTTNIPIRISFSLSEVPSRYLEFRPPRPIPEYRQKVSSVDFVPYQVRTSFEPPRVQPKPHINAVPSLASQDNVAKEQQRQMIQTDKGTQGAIPWQNMPMTFDSNQAKNTLGLTMTKRHPTAVIAAKQRLLPQSKQIDVLKLEEGLSPGRYVGPQEETRKTFRLLNGRSLKSEEVISGSGTTENDEAKAKALTKARAYYSNWS